MFARPIASCAAVAAACALGAPDARAQADWSAHGTLATISGWTDNIALAPDDDPMIAPPESDFFFNLRPGVLVTRGAPRSIHELIYEFQADLNVQHSEANDTSHRVEWRGFFRTSPRSSLIANVAGSMGDTGALVIAGDPSMGQADFIPPAGQTFRRVDGSEVFRYQISQDWRTSQTLGGAHAQTLEEGETITLTDNARFELTGERVWKQQTLGLAAGTEYIQLEAPGQFDGTSRQLDTSVEATYRRDFNENWSGSAFAGVSLLTPLTEGDNGVHPIAQLGAYYRHDVGFGGLLLTREVVPILFAAQTAVNESAALNVGLPLPWLTDDPTAPVLFVGSSVAVTRSRIIDEAGEAQSGWDTILADGGIYYTNREPRVSIGLRYAYNQRIADDMSGVTGYTANTIMLTIGGMYPSRPSGVVPVRGGVRVDQSDLDPTADEAEAAAQARRQQRQGH